MNGRWPKAELKGTQKLAENEVKGEKRSQDEMGRVRPTRKGTECCAHDQYQQTLWQKGPRGKRPRPRSWVTGPATSDETNSIEDGIVEKQAPVQGLVDRQRP
jgi:hypothetical protein